MNTYRDEDVDALVEAATPFTVGVFAHPNQPNAKLSHAISALQSGREAARVEGATPRTNHLMRQELLFMSDIQRLAEQLERELSRVTAELAASKADNSKLRILIGAIATDACDNVIAKHDDELVRECIAHYATKAEEMEQANADNERLTRERDGWKVAMEAAAKVARDNEAERDQFRAVVEDLAKWGKEYHANHGLPILGELGNIINRASELAGKEKQG